MNTQELEYRVVRLETALVELIDVVRELTNSTGKMNDVQEKIIKILKVIVSPETDLDL